MKTASLGETILGWATRDPAVELLVLIGSRARAERGFAAADDHSDWDFQIATADPERFQSGTWLEALGLPPLAYVWRTGRLGSSQKASAVTPAGELDLVVLPVQPLRQVAAVVTQGDGAVPAAVRPALGDLAAVLAGGFRILKGEPEFGRFFGLVSQQAPGNRLDDREVLGLAEAFVCDYVFVRRKIARGELVAAQRWLHQQLAEANYRLLHELRLRRGEPSFPDARRLEQLGEPLASALILGGRPDARELRAAAAAMAGVLRQLMQSLVGDRWRWPDLAASGLGTE